MHRSLSILLLVVAILVVMAGVRQLRQVVAVGDDDGVYLLLLENPRLAADGEQVLAAYTSVLGEEGIAWRRLNQFHLLDLDPLQLVARCPGLVFPEQVCTNGLTPLTHWLQAYMAAGGHLLLVHDVGSRDEAGSLRTNRGLGELLDLVISDDDPTGRRRFGQGAVRFLSPAAAARLGVPPGKLDEDLRLTGYGFGVLDYPLAMARIQPEAQDATAVLAWGENREGPGAPILLERTFGRGGLVYVGLPLGHLKGQADDLPLRMVLRYFADRRAMLPRLLPTPRGIGSLILNWHVDAHHDLDALPRMARAGFLDPELPASWHITAGPDNDQPGDGLGFDACGRGRPLLDLLPTGSEVGSHGGWAHNHFARQLAGGLLPVADQRALIVQNRDCLASLVSHPLREYSSPAGVHPQPDLTRLIAELGFSSYYYTGDGGSAPNRTFYDGRQVSPDVIAFPVLPLQHSASLGEIIRDPGTTADGLARWLDAAARFCADERTIRLLYAHPYDLYTGPGERAFREVWLAWQQDLRDLQRTGRIQVRTMGMVAEFLDRCWRTEAVYRRTGAGLHILLHNPDSLQDLTIAVPRRGLAAPDDDRVTVDQDDDRYYLTIEDTGHALDLLLPAR
jgi:hypothetical protein